MEEHNQFSQTEEDEFRPTHISYREYKKKLSRNPRQGIILFASAFFILLLAFLGAAKLMAPDVDIAIGDEPEVVSEEQGIERAGEVDDRLKQIQDEDNGGVGAIDNTFSPELDEKVKIPDRDKKEEPLSVKEDEPIVLEHTTEPQKPETVETPGRVQTPVTPASVNAKVYVGHYATAEQADVAKSIIMESGLGINVFVKNVNGSYTLQAGSYSSREKAQVMANQLLQNNFPARVVVEAQ